MTIYDPRTSIPAMTPHKQLLNELWYEAALAAGGTTQDQGVLGRLDSAMRGDGEQTEIVCYFRSKAERVWVRAFLSNLSGVDIKFMLGSMGDLKSDVLAHLGCRRGSLEWRTPMTSNDMVKLRLYL